jgi:hypothetical protein
MFIQGSSGWYTPCLRSSSQTKLVYSLFNVPQPDTVKYYLIPQKPCKKLIFHCIPPGACIQYVIPAFIVIFSRADLPEDLKQIPNQFRSPFNSFLWPILILVWAGITIAFVTINHIDKIFQGLITDVAQKVTPGFL